MNLCKKWKDACIRSIIVQRPGGHGVQGNNADATPMLDQSLAIREKILGPDHPELAESLDDKAARLGAEVRIMQR